MITKQQPSNLQRKTLFSIVCAPHLVNHFQTSMMSGLFPFLMKDLGFGYMNIGIISTLRGMAGQFLQALYGFIVQYVKRAVILGTGNVIVGASVIATGFAVSYPFVLVTRIISGLGSSLQHPVGSTMLATHYPAARGRPLALHTTSGSVGSLLAPIRLVSCFSMWTGEPFFV